MKISSLLEDARIRPNLFHWNGRMDSAGLQTWLDQNRWLGDSPADLLAFWQETGGGDIFETETILGPLSDPNLGDDITTLNRDMRSHGMMDRFVVYHMGLLISAYDKVTGDYVELDPSDFHVARRFASFDDWYRDTLRVEYQHRYQLQ